MGAPPPHAVEPARPRLAELLAALSLVTDLARGHPPEEAMRACLLATALADQMSLREDERSHVYYTTLLRFVGCTATSHEYASTFAGSDVAVRARGDMIDPTDPREALGLLFGVTEGRPLPGRIALTAAALPRAKRVTAQGARADCEVGARMARRFDLDPAIEQGLYQMFERWDGKGYPRGLRGEGVALPARFASIAFAALMFHEAEGPDAARSVVHRWSGGALDPSLARAFLQMSDELFDRASPDDAWAAVVAAEPGPALAVSDRRLDEVARGFADSVDLKAPFLHGHSSGVAALAEGAAKALGLSQKEAVDLRRAGLFHDLGRAGVPTGTWEKAGPLSTADWEQVRLHTYHTERILSRAPVLAPLARLAGMHHERLDGSGYHRGAPPQMQPTSARVLAAADVYQALTEERPHRPAMQADRAAGALEAQVGSLDADAVGAVLAAAGQRTARRKRAHPAGLTEREVQVLRLLARGLSEKQVARALFISATTAHTHVAHIYEKAGVSTRAGAAMFAMENDLVRW